MSVNSQMIVKKGKVPTVLVFSDQPEAALSGRVSALRKNWIVPHELSFDKAIDRLQQHTPDLILIDTQTQNKNVFALVRNLRAETAIPILILSCIIPESQIVEMYHAGADECILKPVGQALLIAKIRSWMRHTWKMAMDFSEDIRVNNCELVISSRQLMIKPHLTVGLTNLESRLLYLLISRSPRVIGHDEIIQRVWDSSTDSDYGALKNVIYRLRQKMEVVPTQPKYLVTVPGIGYKFVAQ